MSETVPILTDVVSDAPMPPPSPGMMRVPAQRTLRAPPLPRSRALPNTAVGALAFGVMALGALAIGRLVVDRLSARRERVPR